MSARLHSGDTSVKEAQYGREGEGRGENAHRKGDESISILVEVIRFRRPLLLVSAGRSEVVQQVILSGAPYHPARVWQPYRRFGVGPSGEGVCESERDSGYESERVGCFVIEESGSVGRGCEGEGEGIDVDEFVVAESGEVSSVGGPSEGDNVLPERQDIE